MQKIAYLGIGIMGRGMVGNLLKAGYPVTVWNRTPERAAPLVKQGATQAATPVEAVRDADVERHRRDAIARHDLAHVNLADDGTVAVGDDQFTRTLRQRKQRSSGLRSKIVLLFGSSTNSVGVRRVSPNRNEKAIR